MTFNNSTYLMILTEKLSITKTNDSMFTYDIGCEEIIIKMFHFLKR